MTKAQYRKGTPVFTGVIKYFPDAINALARCSMQGNAQHNPDAPLHWDRSKSGDEMDALMRHAMEAGTMDDDGILHSTKTAWRALANLQKELEQSGEAPMSEYNNMTVEESIEFYLSTQTLIAQSDYDEGVIQNGVIDGTPVLDILAEGDSHE